MELQLDGLDVSLSCNDDCLATQVPIYDLVSVCHHSGSMGGGHYIAEARVEAAGDDTWLEFNDSLVRVPI